MGDALRAVVYNGAGIGDIWQKLAIMGGVDRCLHGDFDTVFSVGNNHP